jgi:hypothetical protein
MGTTGLTRLKGTAAFEDKERNIFAAYESFTARLVARMGEHRDDDDDWLEQLRAGLEVLLDELARCPATTEALTRALPAIRPSAYAHYMALLERLAEFLGGGRRFVAEGEALPAEIEMLALGAAEAIVFDEIEAERTAQLPGLLPAILFSLLVPFLGPEAAAAEMNAAGAAVAL